MKNIKVIRCQSCGSSDVKTMENGICKCNHCSSTMLMPKQNEEIISLLNTARLYRESFNYDLAIKTYQLVLEKDSNELSAYEGILLSEYGIEYVKDSYTGRYIPTCHRAHFTSITENEYYKTLLQLANEEQKESIEIRSKEIDKLQNAISKQLEKEESYDVFLSYKSTNKNGEATKDSVLANQIYNELVKRNYKVFFAQKTLENKLGNEFEPIIFKALHTSKIFILVGTSKENVESPWVRNEWSRFIERIKNNEEDLTNSSFIPVFEGMSPYDMPKVNNQFIQGIDASKIGFEVAIGDAVERICKPQEEKNVIETFNDINNFIEFEKIRKQKLKELKHKNWVDLQTNKNKKAKRFFYNLFLSLPFILLASTLIMLCNKPIWLIASTGFYVIIFLDLFMLITAIITSIVHTRRYNLKVFVQTVLPVSLSFIFVGIYALCTLFIPVTLSGKTSSQMTGHAYSYHNGLYYRTYTYGIGSNGNSSPVVAASICSYDSKIYKNYIYKKDGKEYFVMPDEIKNTPVYYCSYDYIPKTVDTIVIPKNYYSGASLTVTNTSFSEIYVDNSLFPITIDLVDESFGLFSLNRNITIYYTSDENEIGLQYQGSQYGYSLITNNPARPQSAEINGNTISLVKKAFEK